MSRDRLTPEALQLLADIYSGDVAPVDLPDRLKAAHADSNQLAAAASELSTAAARALEPHSHDATPTISPATPLQSARSHHRPLLAAAVALALLALALAYWEWQDGAPTSRRENVAFALMSSQVRGAGDDQRREWVLRVEGNQPGVGYVIGLHDGVPKLEHGQMTLPEQNSYVLSDQDRETRYFLLVLAPNSPINREGVEQLVTSSGGFEPNWEDQLAARISRAGVAWYALSEVEMPAPVR